MREATRCCGVRAALGTIFSFMLAGVALAGEPEDWSLAAGIELVSDAFSAGSSRLAGRRPASREHEIGGVPFRLGARNAVAGTGWRSVMGAEARYALPISGVVSATTSAKVTKVHVAGDADGDRLAGAATVDIHYAAEGLTLDLLPGFEVANHGTGAEQREVGLEGRAAQAIGDDIELGVAARMRWRAADGSEVPAGEVLSGRLGVVCALPYEARLTLAYTARREAAEAGQSPPGATDAWAASVGLSLPIGAHTALSARYRFAHMTNEVAGMSIAAYAEDRHHLGLDVSWDIADNSDLRLLAQYTYQSVDIAHAEGDDEGHAGILSVALGF